MSDETCRWVFGDPTQGSDWHYCGKPRAKHANGQLKRWRWCDEHRAIVVRKEILPETVEQARKRQEKWRNRLVSAA